MYDDENDIEKDKGYEDFPKKNERTACAKGMSRF